MLEADYTLTDVAMNAGSRNGRFSGDENLAVRFFRKPRLDQAASEEQNRPIYREIDYVEIRQPGNKSAVVCRPARDMDKQRFARHWEAYKSRTEDKAVEGTPLEEWPQVSRSQVEELKFFNVFTVEQLASISDSNGQKLMGINMLKQKASEFLEAADGKALKERDLRIQELEDRLAALEEPGEDEDEPED